MDVRFEDHGSVWLARPITDAGRQWIDRHLPDDVIWFGGAVVVEPRYVEGIASGMQGDGLEVGR